MSNQLQILGASLFLAFAAVLIWYVLVSSPLVSNNGSYKGVWSLDFEWSIFQPCNTEHRWVFKPESDAPYQEFRAATGIDNIRELSEPVYVYLEAQGTLGPDNLIYRELAVSSISKLSADVPQDCKYEN
jgi:hypothetical protein